MANKTDTAASSAFLNANIDVSKIFDYVARIVNGLRSSDSAIQGYIPRRSDENLSARNGESFFNAFLRALGLPAVRNDDLLATALVELSTVIGNEEKSQAGTLNYFTLSELGIKDDYNKIFSREKELAGVQPLDVMPAATKENVVSGLRFMLDNIPPDGGVLGTDTRRQPLLPIVACGDVTVFPTSNRIAPIFSEDSPPGEYKPPRAFIEFVIRSRLSTAASFEKSKLVDAIKEKILSIGAPADTTKTPDPLQNDKEAIIKNLENEEIFSLRVVQKLLQALDTSAINYAKVIATVRGHMQNVTYVPSFHGLSPFTLQGYFDITYEDEIKALDEFEAQLKDKPGLKDKLGLTTKPRIDTAIDELEISKAEAEKFFDLLLPTTPVNPTETAYNDFLYLNGVGGASAFGTGTFESVIVEMCTVDRNSISEDLEQRKAERNSIRRELESLRSQLDIFSGYTYGISIFDFLAIILSLYTIPTWALIGLLNSASQQRAAKALGAEFEKVKPSAGQSSQDALREFHDKVKQILNIAKASFNKAQTGSK